MRFHPSHRPDVVPALLWITLTSIGTAVLLGLRSSLPTLPMDWGFSLHFALETLTIGLMVTVSVLAWGTRKEHLTTNMVLLSLGFLCIAALDFAHMLSVPGMPGLFGAAGPDQAIYLWLSARALGMVLLWLIAVHSWRRAIARRTAWYYGAGLLVYLLGVLTVVVQAPAWLPALHDGTGNYSTFKTIVNASLIVLGLATAVCYLLRLSRPREFNAWALVAAVCIMGQTALLFTFAHPASDIHNLASHFYKLLAYTLLCYTIFCEAVLQPYAQLRISREKIRATLQALPDLVLEVDEYGRYLRILAGSAHELTAPEPSLLGKTVHEVMPPVHAQTVMAALGQAQQNGISRGHTIHLYTLKGTEEVFELSIARQSLQLEHPTTFLVIAHNVTAREQARQRLLQLSQAVEQNPISIIITDAQANIEYVNAAFSTITGYSAEEVLGRNPRMLQSGKTPPGSYAAMWGNLTQGRSWQGEMLNRRKDGAEITELMLVYPLRDAQGRITHYLAHKEDVTEQRRTAARLQQLAHYDLLTKLPNRDLLRKRFEQDSAHSRDLTLLWVDLDRFKDINDALGHQQGDTLLIEVAQRLNQHLRPQDTLARIGGDDFVVLLPQTPQNASAEVAEQLLAELARPIVLEAQEVVVTASIGIAHYPSDGQTFDTLLQNAEAAKYEQKALGRNSYGFYCPAIQANAARYLAVSSALKQALQRQELHLVYQPQLSLSDERITGMEVLLRWQHPQWGNISPGEFIPIAEANGTISAIGQWVLETALLQQRQWLDSGQPAIPIAVNLSAQQFKHEGLADLVASLLKQTGVPAHLLELELTEAMAMYDPAAGAQRMQALHALGVRLAMDDFGTGYSSLSYLKRFPIDKLKIDQSFVRDILASPDDQAIASAIIHMAHSLGMRTIAEGVETLEQQDYLHRRGCDEIQGYYFSRPLPAAQLAAFVREKAQPENL